MVSLVSVALMTAGPATTCLASDPTFLKDNIRPYLEEHCIGCHGPEKQKGKFRVDELTDDFADFQNVSAWIEVRDNINLGEMPPEDEPVPPAAASQALSDWVATAIEQAETAAMANDGRVLLRRLNRDEYANSVRDLLHISFLPGESPADLLPPDGKVEGFDKLSAGLMLDPSLLESYYEVARRVAELAIVDGPPPFPTEVMRMEFEDIGHNRAIDYLCDRPGFDCLEDHIELMAGSTRSFGRMHYPEHKTSTPVRGMYRISIRAGARRGTDAEPVKMLVTQSHPDDALEKIMEVEVNATVDKPETFTVTMARDADGGNWHVQLVNESQFTNGNPTYREYFRRVNEAGTAGDFTNAIRYRGRAQLEGGHEQTIIRPDRIDTNDLPMLHLDWIEVEGPLYEQWPPKSHQLIFSENIAADAAAQPDYIRATFSRLLPRAWRRPVSDEEISPYVDYVVGELKAGQTVEDAMRAGIAGMLTSPHFLYLFEPASEHADHPRELNHFELASRLSYLLWSSMPDDELFQLAEQGRLKDPDVIVAQIDRMLADPKVEGFIDGFGSQWLQTENFLTFEPDPRQYQSYDSDLGAAMIGETQHFFREILTRDLDLRNFIDSDFTFVNERLAEHYGIEDVKGENFQKVRLSAGLNRGGLLGQAGVMLAGSDGDRTKPVARGIYVLEVLFNDSPHPPPPNAGEIEPNIQGEKLTVRERLIQHQQIEACASCHKGIDPYGLALENFDVVGLWRTQQNGEGFRSNKAPPIDASGQLPNGEKFANLAEFKEILLSQDRRFFTGLSEKLLVYALGRPHLPSDLSLMEATAESLATKSPTFRELLKQIATSQQFLEK